MPKRHYFTGMVTKRLSNITRDFIEHVVRKVDMEYHYVVAAAMNETTNFSGLLRGIKRGDRFIPLDHELNPIRNVWYRTDYEIVCTEGENLAFAFDGITANDRCHVTYHGYFVKLKER